MGLGKGAAFPAWHLSHLVLAVVLYSLGNRAMPTLSSCRSGGVTLPMVPEVDCDPNLATRTFHPLGTVIAYG